MTLHKKLMNSDLLSKVFSISQSFKIDKKYWTKDNLSGDECTFERSKPGPYIKKSIEIFKLLGLKTIVEIGSTRLGATRKCIDYFETSKDPIKSPACCCDGHSTIFWAMNGFEIHTVDVDENCKRALEWSFNDLQIEFPRNLHVSIPKDGIEFLKEFDGKIDVLFLDGWDKGSTLYAERHLEAWEAAKPKLSDIHCILIDDTDFDSSEGGKDMLLTPRLLSDGYFPLFNGRQSLYLKVDSGMRISLGDIADRYSICRLKSERSDINVRDELAALKREVEKYRLEEYVEELYRINGEIWTLESDLRKGKEGMFTMEEVGRRALQIRDKNRIRVDIKNRVCLDRNSGFMENKANHASEAIDKVIITLTTVMGRLYSDRPDGIIACIESLCNQSFNNYEVHFNVPNKCRLHGHEIVIPEWLEKRSKKYPHLKIFRVDDEGPITKLLPTLRRITDPTTLLIVVDDDLVYHTGMCAEHVAQQKKYNKTCAIGYDGLDVKNEAVFNDVRDHFVVSVYKDVEVKTLQHYKSVSYYRSFFSDDFYTDFVGKTFSDDILVSCYMSKKKIRKMVVAYEKEPQLITLEQWRETGGVTTFPVVRHTSHEPNQGCSDPKAEERFFIPREFISAGYI